MSVARLARRRRSRASPLRGLGARRPFFFGREREREVIVANLLASRLTVLYGRERRRQDLAPPRRASLRRSRIPAPRASSLVVAGRSAAGSSSDRPPVGVESTAARPRGSTQPRSRRRRCLLILDQFEEYFLYHERDGSRDELAASAPRARPRANVLLALREDSLARLDAFKAGSRCVREQFGSTISTAGRARRDPRAARPLERLTGETVEVEPELVEAVLDQVAAGESPSGEPAATASADEDRIEAPYLQLVLERLWEAERDGGSSVLRAETLRALGGARAIVRAHLDGRSARSQPAEQDVAADVRASRHAVGHEDRTSAARPRAVRRRPESEVLPVLDALDASASSTRSTAGRPDRYEIFHDVLADGVLAWRARRMLERDRERAHRRQRRLVVLAAAALLALARDDRGRGLRAHAALARAQRGSAGACEGPSRRLASTCPTSGDPQRALRRRRLSSADGSGVFVPRACSDKRSSVTTSRRVLPAHGAVSAVGVRVRRRAG